MLPDPRAIAYPHEEWRGRFHWREGQERSRERLTRKNTTKARDTPCCRLGSRFPSWGSPGCLRFEGMLVGVTCLASQRTRTFVVLSTLMGRQSGRYSTAVLAIRTQNNGYPTSLNSKRIYIPYAPFSFLVSAGGTTSSWNSLPFALFHFFPVPSDFLSAVLRAGSLSTRYAPPDTPRNSRYRQGFV